MKEEQNSDHMTKTGVSKPNNYKAVTDPVTGETHSLAEWSTILNIPYSSLCRRMKNGWPLEKVLHGERNKTYKPDVKYHNRAYNHIDLTGNRYGMLTVIRRADTDYEYVANGKKKREWKWHCKCDCGDDSYVDVIQHNLLNGHTTNCGCSNRNSLVDMKDKKCGYLTVIEQVTDRSKAEHIKSGGALWSCRCDCGNIVIVTGRDLRARNSTINCGCRSKVANGRSGTRLYTIYQGMMRRCFDPKDPAYGDYGGRGIYVCDEWLTSVGSIKKDGLERFCVWAESNGYSDELTLERINNDLGYSPDNCRWATRKDQARNRRSNHHITLNGVTKTAAEWSEVSGVPGGVIAARHRMGWSEEEAITTQVKQKATVTCFGETHSFKEWSDITGINEGTIYSRIFKLGWSVEAALTTGATNPEIFNHIPCNLIPLYFNLPPAVNMPAIMYYDILGNPYTPEEWDAHQAVYFD